MNTGERRILAGQFDVARRLWAHGRRNPDTGCLEWERSLQGIGYGQMSVYTPRSERNGGPPMTIVKAHRAAWVATYGAIPEGMSVCHRCDNRRCFAPEHLFLGTHADNMADAAQKGRMRRKLSPDDVRVLRARRAAGERFSDLAAAYGVAVHAVASAVHGYTWKHVPGAIPRIPRSERDTDAALAREVGVSRQRVQQLRSSGMSRHDVRAYYAARRSEAA